MNNLHRSWYWDMETAPRQASCIANSHRNLRAKNIHNVIFYQSIHLSIANVISRMDCIQHFKQSASVIIQKKNKLVDAHCTDRSNNCTHILTESVNRWINEWVNRSVVEWAWVSKWMSEWMKQDDHPISKEPWRQKPETADGQTLVPWMLVNNFLHPVISSKSVCKIVKTVFIRYDKTMVPRLSKKTNLESRTDE